MTMELFRLDSKTIAQHMEDGNPQTAYSLMTATIVGGLMMSFMFMHLDTFIMSGGMRAPDVAEIIADDFLKMPIEAKMAVAGAAGLWAWSARKVPNYIEATDGMVVSNSWKVPIGVSRNKRMLLHNFDEIPHAKIGGVTGSGKTQMMKWMLYVLTRQQMPKHLDVYIIDMKGGASFSEWRRCPHVRGVYRTAAEAVVALREINDLMRERLDRIASAKVQLRKPPLFKRILIFIDEGAEISPNSIEGAGEWIRTEKDIRSECMSYLSAIGRIGREPRIGLIYGTQRLSQDAIPVQVRGQMDATFAFRTESENDSNLMGVRDAHLLKGVKGRMYYKCPDGLTEVQTPFISERMIHDWLRHFNPAINIRSRETVGVRIDNEV